MAALLALAAVALSASAQVFVQTTRNGVESQRAQWLADVGVRLALYDVLTAATAPEDARLRAGDVGLTCQLPEGDSLSISIADEAGKVDLNMASDALLRALLTGAGVAPREAATIVDAIADYRDEDSARRLNGAEAPEYRAADRMAGPKNAAFDAVTELGSVIGISGALYQRISAHLTVHSGQDGIDPDHATPELVELLSRATPSSTNVPSQPRSGSVQAGDRLIPSQFVTASTAQAFTLRAEATTTVGQRFSRQAIITRLEGTLPPPASGPEGGGANRRARTQPANQPSTSYRILQWDRVPPGHARPSAKSGELQPC